MAKVSALERAIADLRRERDVLDLALAKLEAQRPSGGKPSRVRTPKTRPLAATTEESA